MNVSRSISMNIVFLLPVLYLLLNQALYASSTPISEAAFRVASILSLPSANSTLSNSTLSEQLTGPTHFPIPSTTITLIIFDIHRQSIDKAALRTLLFNAYTWVSDVIEMMGDGDVFTHHNPYQAETPGASIQVVEEGPGISSLKWSELKEILWGLRDFMVVRGHLFEIQFLIQQGPDTTNFVGFGKVQGYGKVQQYASVVHDME